MPFRIVRNDITKMHCDAIVNTANEYPVVGPGCDTAVYNAAGREELLKLRQKIGRVPEGQAFITPGLKLPAKYIIHAVSPLFIDGKHGEEEKLRSCYRESLRLAREYHLNSVAFPLISTGSFGYPREEGLRIAADEIHAFLLKSEMEITLVVFGTASVDLGRRIYPGLKSYIDYHYVLEKREEEYGDLYFGSIPPDAGSGTTTDVKSGATAEPKADRCAAEIPRSGTSSFLHASLRRQEKGPQKSKHGMAKASQMFLSEREVPFRKDKDEGRYPGKDTGSHADEIAACYPDEIAACYADEDAPFPEDEENSFGEYEQKRLQERIAHLSDTFSEYLMYLIGQKGLSNAEVYKRAIVDKKVFSKIKNNPHYHPQKITAMCLCIGARLNIDEARDLLARAGYALSPADKTDVIFSFFLEKGIYDMIELDIQLEEQGLKCLIS